MNSNLIEYIKDKYPYIISNGDFFYVIENNKIIAFYNGNEIIKLSKNISLPKNKNISTLPILKDDSNHLFTVLSKEKEKELIKYIKNTLKENYDYDAFYDNKNNTFIYIKKIYLKYLNDIIQNMEKDGEMIQICKKEIMYNIDNILKEINNYTNDVSNLFVNLDDTDMKITKKFYQQNKKNINLLLKNLESLEKNEKDKGDDNISYASIFTKDTFTDTNSIYSPQSAFTDDVEIIQKDKKEPNLLLDNIAILKDELKRLKDLYNKDNLYIILKNSYKRRCRKYILNNKDDVINLITDYYNKWINWCDSQNYLNKSEIYSLKKEVIKNTNYLQNILKTIISSDSNKINKNIIYIDSKLKHLLNNQLIYLSIKENTDNSSLSESNTDNLNSLEINYEKNIKYRLKKLGELLYLNNNTSINTEYNNKEEQIFNFITLNNIFFRKQRVVTELNDIIQNENLDTRDYILDKFNKIKDDLNKHIYFLNLQEIINSPFLQYHKNNKFIDYNIPETFYNNIINILDFCNFNILYYRNQDLDLLNIIDDLIEDINIYIRIKPPIDVNDKTLLISTKTTENDIILNGKTYNDFTNVFPDDFTNLDVYIGKQDFENKYLLDNVNFLENINTVPNGLYNAFNKLQNGYSLFLYGNGISGSGTSYTFFGENNIPGIVQYGLANLKNVSNIKLKYLFEQYVSNANDKYIKGNIHNLINIVPELNEYFSVDETTEFSEIIPSYINVKSLNVKDLQDLCEIINTHRTKMNRIKELPTGKSSRSSLYYIFQINFHHDNKPIKTYLTVVDSCGQDSPDDIYKYFIKDMNLENLMICNKDEAMNFIQKHAKKDIKNDYSPEFIYKCIQESIYNNEALNHFNYYMNSKNNYYDTIKYHNFDEKNYNKSMYFVNPTSEFDTINRNNNCLTIPIMKFIENTSLKKDINRIKYHLFYNIRRELTYIPQTTYTLYLTKDINSKKLFGSIQKLENKSNYTQNESNYTQNQSDFIEKENNSNYIQYKGEESIITLPLPTVSIDGKVDAKISNQSIQKTINPCNNIKIIIQKDI